MVRGFFRRLGVRLALAGVTIAATAMVTAPAARAEVCQHRTGQQHGGGIFPTTFTEDSVCGHKAGAPVYADPTATSPQVGVLDGTSSWFLCWTRGQVHAGGNDVWYYTQGDRVISDPNRQAYGFVPASHLNTVSNPDDARLAPCPAAAATTAYMSYDRISGATVKKDEHKQFRSASLVKLLIALDYLEKRGPSATIPAGDAQRLQTMLRSSDDTAASQLWVQEGWTAIVTRMRDKIGLTDTEPPAQSGQWGDTAISAADVVTVYRYILETANPKFRDLIMGHLHQATRCAKDGWDQFFGIPGAVPAPYAVKQGWSGFGDPNPVCGSAPAKKAAAAIDETSVAMHTSGTVCSNDRKILVVLSVNQRGTSWKTSADRLTAATASVYNSAKC